MNSVIPHEKSTEKTTALRIPLNRFIVEYPYSANTNEATFEWFNFTYTVTNIFSSTVR